MRKHFANQNEYLQLWHNKFAKGFFDFAIKLKAGGSFEDLDEDVRRAYLIKRNGHTIKSYAVEVSNKYSNEDICFQKQIFENLSESIKCNVIDIKQDDVPSVFKNVFELIREIVFQSDRKTKAVTVLPDEIKIDLFSKLWPKICPYCDLMKSMSHTNYKFEHFMPIDKFPYLVVCPENINLSCERCNHFEKGKSNRYFPPVYNIKEIEIGLNVKFTADWVNKSIIVKSTNDESKNYLETIKFQEHLSELDKREFDYIHATVNRYVKNCEQYLSQEIYYYIVNDLIKA